MILSDICSTFTEARFNTLTGISVISDIPSKSSSNSFKSLTIRDRNSLLFILTKFNSINQELRSWLNPTSSIFERDFSICFYYLFAENSEFIDKKTVSGTIEKITKNYLTIDGTKYKFDSDFKFLSLASNAPALKDAAISITIKNNQLQTIDNLHILANAEKLNLQGSIINTLTLPASLELLKDVQASKISYSATPTTLKFDQVTALTVDIQQERAKTASLLPMANANQQTVATFANSSINDLHIETTQSTITNENSLISNLHALTTATLTLNGAFLNVYVTNLLQLLGTASISHLHSSANNFSTFNIHWNKYNNLI